MTGPVGSNELEKEILRLLEDLPLAAGIPEYLRQLLLQAGRPFAMKTALAFLASADDKKKSAGAKIAMLVDSEKNINLILPLLEEANWLILWQVMYSVLRLFFGQLSKLHDVNTSLNLLKDAQTNLNIHPPFQIPKCQVRGYFVSYSSIIFFLNNSSTIY